MSKAQLHYYSATGRANQIRFALAAADFEFEDVFPTCGFPPSVEQKSYNKYSNVSHARWKSLHSIICDHQSSGNLMPSNDDDLYKTDKLIADAEDFRSAAYKTFMDWGATKEAYENFVYEFMPVHLGNFERQLLETTGEGGDGFFVEKDRLTIADVAIYDALVNFGYNRAPTDCLDKFPHIAAWIERMEAHPRIAKYLASEQFAKVQIKFQRPKYISSKEKLVVNPSMYFINGDSLKVLVISYLTYDELFNTVSNAYELQALPKVHSSSLPIETFDQVYLDQLPIILSGGPSICPPNMDFTSIQDQCQGNIPSNYVHKKSKTESVWAGLQAGDKKQMIDFNEWAKHMGRKYDRSDNHERKSEEPQFLFDVPVVEICPDFYGNITIPSYFIGKFSSQFKHRKTTRGDSLEQRDGGLRKGKDSSDSRGNESDLLNELCTNLPFFNIYMAAKSFQTDLHIDAGHTAFMASMCVGRKRWRVMTNKDYAKIYSKIGLEGIAINDKHIMGTIRSPFNTWSEEADNDLYGANVTVYEGILNPGELLYIPAGFPHAATTLDDSIMIASNDHSFTNLQEGIEFCERIDNDHVACPGIRQKFKAFSHNQQIATTMKRQDMLLPQSSGCEKTYQLLLDVNESNNIVEILPSNFHSQIQLGPMIILKSQKNCGFCQYLLKHWKDITSDYFPPVQFGTLNCFQGQCQHGANELYQQLLHRFEGLTSPQLLYVSFDNSRNELMFVDYFGQYTINDIRVWASYNAESRIFLEPLWFKMLWLAFHAMTYHTMTITDKIGTTGLGLLLFSLIFSSFVAFAQWSSKTQAHDKRKRKQQ